MTLSEKHLALVEAINGATTQTERSEREAERRGFLDAVEIIHGFGAAGHLGMEADWHYINQEIDRPMCCGVFLDWTPKAKEGGSHE